MGFLSVFSQSSLVPLAKIANAPTRPLRLLWAVFTATMFMVLCVCITLVVIQYCKHQTVFQLDYSGRYMVYDQIPGITICPQAAEAKKLFSRFVAMPGTDTRLPWQDKILIEQFRQRVLASSPNLSFDVITHRLPVGELVWNTSTTAISPIYQLLHNFTVRFNVQPPKSARSYRLTVMEQVPNARSFLCTTFELRSPSPKDRWSYLEVEIDQSASIDDPISFTIITHERGELPFSAYDRHIHTIINPKSIISLYFSKSVTSRLQTARNPCHEGPDAKSMAAEYAKSSEDPLSSTEDPVDGVIGFPDKDWEIDDRQVTWYEDFLDKLRLNLTQTNSLSTREAQSNPQNPSKVDRASKFQEKSKAVLLFGTAFLYGRESCGWAECWRQVLRECGCNCTLHVLGYNEAACRGGPACEKKHCVDQQISYKICPLPCVMTKFIKHNEVTVSGAEANISVGVCKLKLIRSESVHVATEEEIFSLAKLFSEVGGLCSLFIGFSCIFLFELLEAVILMHSTPNDARHALRLKSEENQTHRDGEGSGRHTFPNQCCCAEVNHPSLISGEPEETNGMLENTPFVCNNRFAVTSTNGSPEKRPYVPQSQHFLNVSENTDSRCYLDDSFSSSREIMTNQSIENMPAVGPLEHKAVWKDDILILPVWPAMLLTQDSSAFSAEVGQLDSPEGKLARSKRCQELPITPDQILTLLEQKRVKFRLILN
ncbi:hypothetical protein CRM22_009542 [Opisthorchis felineus]|uniref:Uncharacterized protein n=1 Tax=Opisthorchis felineus TaxID=147828 RepID=A0A4S2L784_OPIFE|nr:hypothetical protein CRM22_009542 [Opisthorchis felineus]